MSAIIVAFLSVVCRRLVTVGYCEQNDYKSSEQGKIAT